VPSSFIRVHSFKVSAVLILAEASNLLFLAVSLAKHAPKAVLAILKFFKLFASPEQVPPNQQRELPPGNGPERRGKREPEHRCEPVK
jgi:hypothetical protein